MKRKTKATRGPIEYCKLIFWSISILKVVCSFYHVYWHPTLMDEYNKMQEKLERAQDQHMEFAHQDLINKEYGKRIEPEFQAKYEQDKKMLDKKSRKARQKREEVDRVVVDMDSTAFSLEYRMAIAETGQSSMSLNAVLFFLPLMFFSARLAMLVTTLSLVLAVFVLPWDIDVELGKLVPEDFLSVLAYRAIMLLVHLGGGFYLNFAIITDFAGFVGLPVPIMTALNVVHALSILGLLIGEFVRDDKISKWWRRLFPPPTPPDKRLVDFMENCKTGRDKVRLRVLLHDREFNPNQTEPGTGNSGLHLACQHGQASVVQSLLDVKRRNLNLNIENYDHKTPLMMACSVGNSIIVGRLLKERKLKLRDHFGEEAIKAAVGGGHFTLAQKVAEEITRRGLCLRDYSRNLRENRTLLVALREGTSLERRESRSMAEETREQELRLRREDILQAMQRVSENDNRAPQPRTQSSITEELREYIDEPCKICCEEFRDTRLFACSNGHWICSECKDKNRVKNDDRCPECRTDFRVHPPIRCWTSESMLRLIGTLPRTGVHEQLGAFLKCRVCHQEYGDAGVFACSRDHWICSRCYPRNEACATCGENIQSSEPRRCRTSEKVLKLIQVLEAPGS